MAKDLGPPVPGLFSSFPLFSLNALEFTQLYIPHQNEVLFHRILRRASVPGDLAQLTSVYSRPSLATTTGGGVTGEGDGVMQAEVICTNDF